MIYFIKFLLIIYILLLCVRVYVTDPFIFYRFSIIPRVFFVVLVFISLCFLCFLVTYVLFVCLFAVCSLCCCVVISLEVFQRGKLFLFVVCGRAVRLCAVYLVCLFCCCSLLMWCI